MPREQLFSPRLPNQGDVPLTQARVGALFLEHTDGAPILVRARSVPKPAVRIAAYAPGCWREVEARQTIVRALA